MGPVPASTVLTSEEEAIAAAFRRHTLLPLDDCLYALQATIPRLSRSALHRCFQCHGVSRLPLSKDGQSPPKKKFKDYPIGYLHVDFAELQTEGGRQYLFVAIDRTIKEATVQRYHDQTTAELNDHMQAFLLAYNHAKRIKTLRDLTQHEFVCAQRQKNPAIFTRDPTHLTLGLYS